MLRIPAKRSRYDRVGKDVKGRAVQEEWTSPTRSEIFMAGLRGFGGLEGPSSATPGQPAQTGKSMRLTLPLTLNDGRTERHANGQGGRARCLRFLQRDRSEGRRPSTSLPDLRRRRRGTGGTALGLRSIRQRDPMPELQG